MTQLLTMQIFEFIVFQIGCRIVEFLHYFTGSNLLTYKQRQCSYIFPFCFYTLINYSPDLKENLARFSKFSHYIYISVHCNLNFTARGS